MRAAVALAGLMLVLAACGSSEKPPAPPPPPATVKLALTASEQLNPNSSGQPSPVVVRIYELKSLDQFANAEFFQLFDQDQQVLGQTLVARRELIVKPGEKLSVEASAAGSNETRFVGVLAAYREVQSATWRASVPVIEHFQNTPSVKLDVNSLSMQPSPPPPPPPEKKSWWWPF